MEMKAKEKKKKALILGLNFLGLIIFFVLWELSVKLGWVSSKTLVPPSTVVKTFIYKLNNTSPDGSTLPKHFWTSLKLALSSFIVAVIIGVPLGWVMGYYKVASLVLTPIFEILRPIPPIAWIPIIILTMGIGMPAKMFIIFVSAFVPCVINSYLGIRLTDPVKINVAKTFGANDWKIFTTVCIPSSLHMVFTGIRLSLNNSWTTLVAAEMLAGTSGLGYMIQLGRTLIRPDIIIVGMITIGMTGALMNFLLSRLEKKITPWRNGDE